MRCEVFEIKESKAILRGEFDFVEVPSPSDRVVIGNARGDLEMFRVARLKHLPVGLPHGKFDAKPTVKVYVEWVEPWNEKG